MSEKGLAPGCPQTPQRLCAHTFYASYSDSALTSALLAHQRVTNRSCWVLLNLFPTLGRHEDAHTYREDVSLSSCREEVKRLPL
jgi:hypothetical protein